MKKYFVIVLFFGGLLLAFAQSVASEDKPPAITESTVVKIKVFPNPATNVVNVLGLKNTAKADIFVLDIYGNTILGYQWAIRRNALNIPIAQLESGPYIIRIRSEENEVLAKFYKR